MKLLSEIAKKLDTDKGIGSHEYTEVYDSYLLPLKDEKLNFFEIGIFKGESLKLWEEYFQHSNIIGLDINPECKKYEGDRKKVYIGSQDDEVLLWKISVENSPLSIIIDDGSHYWEHQIKTFKTLFPLLNPGGIYFVEDLHTSYMSNWEGGKGTTGVNFFKTLIDDVMIRGKSFTGINEIGNQPLSYNEHYIEYVHFYKSLCIIKKRQNPI